MKQQACNLHLTLLSPNDKCPSCGWPASDHRNYPRDRARPKSQPEVLSGPRLSASETLILSEAKELQRTSRTLCRAAMELALVAMELGEALDPE